MLRKCLVLVMGILSLSSFADSELLQTVNTGDCGGKLELREANSGSQTILKAIGINQCSNLVFVTTNEKYKLTDENGKFQNKSFTLSKEAVSAAKNGGLKIELYSNTKSTYAGPFYLTIKSKRSQSASVTAEVINYNQVRLNGKIPNSYYAVAPFEVNFYINGKFLKQIKSNDNGSFSYTTPAGEFYRGNSVKIKVLNYFSNGSHYEFSGTVR